MRWTRNQRRRIKIPYAQTTNPTPYNHYALLCSLEDVWSLDHLGFAGAPGLTCFGKDVYNQPA